MLVNLQRAASLGKASLVSPTKNDDCPKSLGQTHSLSESFSGVQ